MGAAMNAKRLLKLADFLDTVPRKSFSMSMWETSPATKPETAKLGECGFAGCALGWAVHGALFRQLTPTDGGTPQYRKKPGSRRRFGFEAAEHLFDIDPDDARFLFGSYTDVTPRQEARRIRKFVASAS
jgi:hypothetical protein